MIRMLKNIFRRGPRADMKELVRNGAQIIDVRSESEFRGGHIRGAINIPLQQLPGNVSRIRKDKPVITCCASGIRSASARTILKSKGFTEVHNGGGWLNLQGKIS